MLNASQFKTGEANANELLAKAVSLDSDYSLQSQSWSSNSEGSPNFDPAVSVQLILIKSANAKENDYVIVRFRIGETSSSLSREVKKGEYPTAQDTFDSMAPMFRTLGFGINENFPPFELPKIDAIPHESNLAPETAPDELAESNEIEAPVEAPETETAATELATSAVSQ